MRITEIFYSLQGESRFAGLPCAFVRTTGCNLRCTWCDSEYTFQGGSEMSVEEVGNALAKFSTRRVEITGGEPLLQKDIYALFERLLAGGYEILLETSGSLPISDVPRAVCRVVDYKLAGSSEGGRFHAANWQALSPHDEVKFVINDRADFDEACAIARQNMPPGVPFSFSPVHGVLAPEVLAEWLLASGLDARLNLQIHKYLWGNVHGR